MKEEIQVVPLDKDPSKGDPKITEIQFDKDPSKGDPKITEIQLNEDLGRYGVYGIKIVIENAPFKISSTPQEFRLMGERLTGSGGY